MGVITVDIDLIELGELDVVLQRAELMDLLDGAWCLLAKLIAGEVENLQATLMELLVERLQFGVLRREAAKGGCVDNQQHIAPV